MNLLAFIITSILLSWLGLAIYAGFRRMRVGLMVRRVLIWVIILASLGLPLVSSIRAYRNNDNPVPMRHGSVHEFCHCANPSASELIHYQASKVQDVFLEYRPYIWGFFLFTLLLVLFRFSATLGRIAVFTWKNQGEAMYFQGKQIVLVNGMKSIKAGALRLGKRYLFWDSSLDNLSEEERQAILLHEWSHLRQGNTYELLFLGLAQCVWFFNPAYYFFRRELIQISELQADAYVIAQTGKRKTYAQLLLRMKSEPAFAMISLFGGGFFKQRIHAILQPQPQTRFQPLLVAAAGLMLILPSEAMAEQVIQGKIKEIAVYELLTEVNQQTGEDEFCKKCTYEIIDHCN